MEDLGNVVGGVKKFFSRDDDSDDSSQFSQMIEIYNVYCKVRFVLKISIYPRCELIIIN